MFESKHLLRCWYQAAIEYWLLSKAAATHLDFCTTPQHLHTLSFEMILKLMILLHDKTIDPALLRKTSGSRTVFGKSHDVFALINRWNRLDVSPRILKGGTDYSFTRQGNDVLLSDDSWKSLRIANDSDYSGRYIEGGFIWSHSTGETIDYIFFELREIAKNKLGIIKDIYDFAVDGTLGAERDSEWVKKIVSMEYGLPPNVPIPALISRLKMVTTDK